MNSEDTYSRRPTFDDIVKLRGRRLAWLDKLIIRGRNALRMKSLLRVIEGHDRSNVGVYLDIATIATGMGCEERTARRAINDCRAAGLLPKNEKSSRGGRVNAYKIQWDVVAQMIIDHPETIHLIAPHEAPPRPRELPFDAEQPRTLVPRTPDTCAREPRTLVHPTPDTCAGNPGHLRPEPRTLVQGTPDTCASEEGVDDLIHRARVLKPTAEQVALEGRVRQFLEVNGPSKVKAIAEAVNATYGQAYNVLIGRHRAWFRQDLKSKEWSLKSHG